MDFLLISVITFIVISTIVLLFWLDKKDKKLIAKYQSVKTSDLENFWLYNIDDQILVANGSNDFYNGVNEFEHVHNIKIKRVQKYVILDVSSDTIKVRLDDKLLDYVHFIKPCSIVKNLTVDEKFFKLKKEKFESYKTIYKDIYINDDNI